MKVKNIVLTILLIFISSCTIETNAPYVEPEVEDDDMMKFDIQSIESMKNIANTKNIRRSFYPLTESERRITPTRFIIKVGTVAINFGTGSSGRIMFFDKPNDADCVEIDLANDEMLSDFIDCIAPYNGNPVMSIYVGILRTIEYTYIDKEDKVHNGTITLPLNLQAQNFCAEIGTSRGRIALGTVMLDEERGWGDARFSVSEEKEKRKITLLFDLDGILHDDDKDGVAEIDERYGDRMIPVTPGMKYEEYYFRKSGVEGNGYSHRISMLYTKDWELLNKLRIDNIGGSIATIPEFNNFNWNGNLIKNEVVSINNEGAITFKFSTGGVLPNIGKKDVYNIQLGNSFYDMKYVIYDF